MRVFVDRRAVAQVTDRDQVRGTDAAQELAHIAATAQALVAGAALRRARHADAIAHLHAPHFRPNSFDRCRRRRVPG